jgi:hypothetical protein
MTPAEFELLHGSRIKSTLMHLRSIEAAVVEDCKQLANGKGIGGPALAAAVDKRVELAVRLYAAMLVAESKK